MVPAVFAMAHVLRAPLAEVIFAAPLRELRQGAADAGDVRMC
eukprot:gene26104-16962_t